ncbi:MAG: hypothetical protein QNJ40_24450 [Xanthomonadales bacterium]|nr:hypothetical protein [Xanthomonadales bacterium]
MEFDMTNAYPASIRRLDKVVNEAANDAQLSAPVNANTQHFIRKFLTERPGFSLQRADNN